MGKPIWGKWAITMTVHNYRSRQVHETLNGVNPSSGFRYMRSAKSGPNLWQIWQVFGPWASPYGANGRMSMTVHNYRPRQFHRTSNGENPSSSYRDMGSASLAAARPTARPPARQSARPPARTVTTIPLRPGGLRGKKIMRYIKIYKYVTGYHRFSCTYHDCMYLCSAKLRKIYISTMSASTWSAILNNISSVKQHFKLLVTQTPMLSKFWAGPV